MARTVFLDVNETLSDPSSLSPLFTSLGVRGETPSTWLAATLRDGFALSLSTGARSFAEVARATLTTLLSAQEHRAGTVQDGVERIMSGFSSLPVHDDVVEGVRRLRSAGHRLVALSNGTAEYAEALLGRAGVVDAFDACTSVDALGVWKPDRRTYEHALSSTDTAAADATLVAAHPWDLHGARAVGFRTVHVDRRGTSWPAVFDAPDVRVRSLTDLEL
ncbi:haloacid dehalogenase type II [Curtobacterium sp. MCSS17_008]|uniref:haloacid dehalogenase type II n=1 Tax=Curtobacterium sp. MCSS17_008 TaxID=2175647 RepID=UPI000DA80D4E|nr:haloacid dehalogenase type II [Curtobacterium sp. MCSS17_008]PZF57871.1 haloacid dehalogenase type II [Curtobacterium sp. MCSS17_008]